MLKAVPKSTKTNVKRDSVVLLGQVRASLMWMKSLRLSTAHFTTFRKMCGQSRLLFCYLSCYADDTQFLLHCMCNVMYFQQCIDLLDALLEIYKMEEILAFSASASTLLAGHSTCKKLGVGLLVVTI